MKEKILRSQQWFGKKGKDGFIYRAWMKNQGIPADEFQYSEALIKSRAPLRYYTSATLPLLVFRASIVYYLHNQSYHKQKPHATSST